MHEFAIAQNQKHHEASGYHPVDYKAMQNPSTIPANTALPPIRRINNHLPPKNFRMPSVPRSETGQAKPNSNFVKENINRQTRFLDGESVMNLSHSGSGSDSEDGSYTDDDSDEQTTFSYIEDETPPTNFNCMNSLFLPASNDQEMNDAAIIRCHRVGPSSAELQLNIPLPAHYMNHRLPPINEGGHGGGYMDNVCKAPSLNYNPVLFEEAVVEIDPFKQYRERIAPQFYESLIEEDSDEDADNGDSEDENDDDSVRQRDDSQIFGYFDAQRSAMQQAIYNGIVLQSPPSQIFVTESSCTSVTPALATSEQGSQEVLNSIELSIGGSSDVFSRPEDGQDSSLRKHLREVVEIGNAAPSKSNDHPKHVMSTPSSYAPSTQAFSKHMESAPSMDESSHPSVNKTRPPVVSSKTLFSVTENDDGKKRPAKYFDSIRKCNSPLEQRGENSFSVTSHAATRQTPSILAEGAYRHSLAAFPSFDEPGRITSRPGIEAKEQSTLEQVLENEKTTVSNDPIEDLGEISLLPTNAGKVSRENVPDDETFGISSPTARFARAFNGFVHEEDGPADEKIGFLSPQPSPSYPSTSKPFDCESNENISTRAETLNVRYLNENTKQVNIESKTQTTNPTSQISTESENEMIQRKFSAPSKSPGGSHGRFSIRPILEETSKSNVRTKIYETSTEVETSEKSSRELRKDRIRTFDSVRPARSPDLVSMLDRVSIDASRRSQPNILDENVQSNQIVDVPSIGCSSLSPSPEHNRFNGQDGASDEVVPDLDDLMEFHSCDEDFFTLSHTRSEQFSSVSSNVYC